LDIKALGAEPLKIRIMNRYFLRIQRFGCGRWTRQTDRKGSTKFSNTVLERGDL
jgi:hypothetical protein